MPEAAEVSAVEQTDARVYFAPPLDGLSTFNLGSVPASVTPPRSWRKAAWFAGLASFAVVVAMLLAATAVVGQAPAPANRQYDGWPGRGGHPIPPAPTVEQPLAGDRGPQVAGVPTTTEDTSDAIASLSTTSARSSTDRTTNSEDSATVPSPGPPTRSSAGPPEKPPVTPAPTTTAERRLLISRYDAETLAERSQDFLDLVTEDPESAHAMTSGELEDEGPEGLRARYAKVAFFEVLHIYIDDNEGYTANEVRTTYTDGSTRTETRELFFSQNSKISADSR